MPLALVPADSAAEYRLETIQLPAESSDADGRKLLPVPIAMEYNVTVECVDDGLLPAPRTTSRRLMIVFQLENSSSGDQSEQQVSVATAAVDGCAASAMPGSGVERDDAASENREKVANNVTAAVEISLRPAAGAC